MGVRAAALCVLATLCLLAIPARSTATSPDPSGESSVQPVTGTPPTSSEPHSAGAVGNSVTEPAAPKPINPFTGKKCFTRHQRRTCRIYRNGALIEICVRVRHGHNHCGRVKARTASAITPTATIAAVGTNQGFREPLPPVGKIFKEEPGHEPQSHCSGTLFTPRLIITAAHCLYSIDAKREGFTGPFLDHMNLYFAADASFGSYQGSAFKSAVWPSGYYVKIVQWWVPKPWASGNAAYDYGVAEIKPYPNGSYLGSYTGLFPLAWNYEVAIGKQYYLMGYPSTGLFYLFGYGDKPYYCNDSYDNKFAPIGHNGTPPVEYLAALECKATLGMSGGPVFAIVKGTWHVVGVVNAGNKENTLRPSPGEEWVAWNYWGSQFGTWLCGNWPSLCS